MLNKMKQYVSSKSMSIYNMMIPERSDLREIKMRVDFDFIYKIVSPFYSEFEGRRSYDPVRLIKMEYLKIRYKISGDNELLAEIKDRASFRDFLGIDINEELPDRTTLVHFRTQIGVKIINEIFETIVDMCKKENMVGGKHSVFDGTNTKADARIVATRDKIYKEENIKKKTVLEGDTYKIETNQTASFINLERTSYPKNDDALKTERAKEMVAVGDRVSEGDEDARFYKSKHGEQSKLGYQNAFEIDIKDGIITRVVTITGNGSMADEFKKILEEKQVPEISADGEFATGEIIDLAQKMEIILNVPPRKETGRDTFAKSSFEYNAETDTYICPNAEILQRKTTNDSGTFYKALTSSCKNCEFKEKCTKSKARSILRNKYELQWEIHEEYTKTDNYQFGKVIRGILAEGKFYQANKMFGLDNSIYTGTDKMSFQAKMTATILNIKRFLKVLAGRAMGKYPTSLAV